MQNTKSYFKKENDELMASALDISLGKIKKELSSLWPGAFPATLDEFLYSSKIPKTTQIDYEKIFRDLYAFLRNVKKRNEPDIIVWLFVREKMFDIYQQYGDHPRDFNTAIKRAFGYDRSRPDEDWAGQAGRDAIQDRLDRQEDNIDRMERIEKNAPKISKQLSDLREIPKEDLDKILCLEPDTEAQIKDPETFQYVKERDYYFKRKNDYRNSYNLNSSADAPLLNEVVMREIQLARFDEYMAKNHNRFTGDARDKVFEGLCKAQKALGISREQRIDAEGVAKDTIADLADTFEAYIQEHHIDLSNLFALEEIEMLLQKYDRGEFRGTKELSEHSFKYLTKGTSVEEARKILADNKELMESLDKQASQIKF